MVTSHRGSVVAEVVAYICSDLSDSCLTTSRHSTVANHERLQWGSKMVAGTLPASSADTTSHLRTPFLLCAFSHAQRWNLLMNTLLPSLY